MVDSAAQLAQVVNKLLSKTSSGQQKWKPSLRPGTYQARFGNFAVEISGVSSENTISVFGKARGTNASIKVTKLDGMFVAEAGGNSGSLASSITVRGGASFDNGAQEELNKLYRLVADRSKDLDELIDLI